MTEDCHIAAETALSLGEGLQSRRSVEGDGAVEELMCQRRDVGVVGQSVFA